MEENSGSFDKVKNIMSDPDTLLFELKKKKKDILFWAAGIFFTLFIYLFVSSKDFSFLIIMQAIFQLMSFVIVVWSIRSYQSVSGLSLNTAICYLFVIISRLTSTLFYSGYLPSDEAGDWFYQLTEVLTLLCVIALVYMITTSYKESYNADMDVISWTWLVVPTLALALLFHTNLNRNLLTDAAWTFSMYLETVAIYPQIHLFVKKGGYIEPFTSHYVSLQGLSRLFSLIFWWYTYEELIAAATDSGYSLFPELCGYLVIISQVLQLVIMIDYYYHYFKGLFKGEQMNFNDI